MVILPRPETSYKNKLRGNMKTLVENADRKKYGGFSASFKIIKRQHKMNLYFPKKTRFVFISSKKNKKDPIIMEAQDNHGEV